MNPGNSVLGVSTGGGALAFGAFASRSDASIAAFSSGSFSSSFAAVEGRVERLISGGSEGCHLYVDGEG